MGVIVRKIEKHDKNDWSQMRNALWPDCRDEHQDEIQEFFDKASPDIAEVLLLDNGSSVFGFLELNIRSFAEGSRNKGVPYVEAWYVKPQYQGQGYGKRLMQAAERWALEKGYNELASDTEITNSLSQKAHSALGFKEVDRVVCYLKRLKE